VQGSRGRDLEERNRALEGELAAIRGTPYLDPRPTRPSVESFLLIVRRLFHGTFVLDFAVPMKLLSLRTCGTLWEGAVAEILFGREDAWCTRRHLHGKYVSCRRSGEC
jgi:hypothetical protein